MKADAINLKRRALLASLGAVAVNAAMAFFSSEAIAHEIVLAQGDAPNSVLDYEKLVLDGEAALALGEADKAADIFELAGGKRHAAASELGLVRAWMQMGLYRRALGFLAHAAGVHLDFPAGTGLYVWLLYAGGQRDYAKRKLEEILRLFPDHPVLMATASLINNPAQILPELLLTAPARFAPYSNAGIPAAASSIGSALRISATQVIAPKVSLKNGGDIWLRDIQGRVAKARVTREFDDLGLVLLETNALSDPVLSPWTTRLAFPGSAGYALEYLAMPHAQPCWPLLQVGFLGNYDEHKGYALGIGLASSGSHGGPVLDRFGSLVGVAIRAADGVNRLIPAMRLQKLLTGLTPELNVNSSVLSSDEIYERACNITVQLLV